MILVGILPAGAAAGAVIAYDDGTSAAGYAYDFQGVRFSLPAGMVEARLLDVRFQYSDTSASLTIRVTRDDHLTALAPPIAHTNTGADWQVVNVSASNIRLPKNFYVVLAAGVSGNPVIDAVSNASRSFGGDTLSQMNNPLPGDLLLRVDVAAVLPLFADGFESANTSHWSATVP